MEVHKRQRLTREQRREQILTVALETVASQGVRGATLTNIAAGVGITYPALYAHFPSRNDLLLAVLDRLFDRVRQLFVDAYREKAVEHLRQIGRINAELAAAGEDGCILPFFEFVAADPGNALRKAFGERVLVIVELLADIVRRGKREGTIVPDADPEQIAWLIVACGWTDDIAALMGLGDSWNKARSQTMLDWVLSTVAVGRPEAETRRA